MRNNLYLPSFTILLTDLRSFILASSGIAPVFKFNSSATCTQKAIYFYSCICGEKGTKSFEFGDFAEHSFTKEVADEKYLKSAATCKQQERQENRIKNLGDFV